MFVARCRRYFFPCSKECLVNSLPDQNVAEFECECASA
jgi:hypothetical protein